MSIQLTTAVVKDHTYIVMVDSANNTARVSSKSDPKGTHVVTADGCDCTYTKYHPTKVCAHQLAVSCVHQQKEASKR